MCYLNIRHSDRGMRGVDLSLSKAKEGHGVD